MESWRKVISYFKTESFLNLQKFMEQERSIGKSILPKKEDVFNALSLTPFNDVKVVILGQDPYPNKRHAHGLAFSIPKLEQDIPKSLKNILKELESDIGIVSRSGNLEKWARNGVLLLNTVLTVEEGMSNSHKGKGWETLTSEIIATVNEKLDHVVFILWGRRAQKFKKKISSTKHFIIESPHPSPLSSYRGFFGSKPFSRANSYLAKMNKPQINWQI